MAPPASANEAASTFLGRDAPFDHQVPKGDTHDLTGPTQQHREQAWQVLDFAETLPHGTS